jgi:hypothetical protein
MQAASNRLSHDNGSVSRPPPRIRNTTASLGARNESLKEQQIRLTDEIRRRSRAKSAAGGKKGEREADRKRSRVPCESLVPSFFCNRHGALSRTPNNELVDSGIGIKSNEGGPEELAARTRGGVTTSAQSFFPSRRAPEGRSSRRQKAASL